MVFFKNVKNLWNQNECFRFCKMMPYYDYVDNLINVIVFYGKKYEKNNFLWRHKYSLFSIFVKSQDYRNVKCESHCQFIKLKFPFTANIQDHIYCFVFQQGEKLHYFLWTMVETFHIWEWQYYLYYESKWVKKYYDILHTIFILGYN